MNLKRFLKTIVICLFSYGAMAEALDSQKWRTQSANVKSGIVNVHEGQIEFLRKDSYPERSMLRAYQDVKVKSGAVYQLSYLTSVKGVGSGYVTIYFGNKAGRWENKRRLYKTDMKQCDFTEIKFNIVVPEDVAKLRIDFRAFGINTEVVYKNIVLGLVKKGKDIILVPVADNVVLDGRLNDVLWKKAIKLTPFLWLGNINRPLPVKSTALIALKDDYLYVGYRLEEPSVKKMKISTTDDVSEMENPIRIAQDDCVETFFTVDKKSFSHLIVNPSGVKYWEQVNADKAQRTWFPTGKTDFSGEWEAKSFMGKNSWTVEMRIKLSALFGKKVGGKQVLFANFTRHRPWSNEKNHTWAALSGKKYKALSEFMPLILEFPQLKKSQHKNSLNSEFTRRFEIPELMLTGKPVKLIRQADKKFRLGKEVKFDDQAGVLSDDLKKMLIKVVGSEANGGEVRVVLRLRKSLETSGLNSSELKKMKSPEAFKLQLEPGKAIVEGVTDKGVLRGIATLVLLAKRSRLQPEVALPALTIYDAPRMPFRGWFISHAGKKLKQMIGLAYLLRFNKILISMHDFHRPTFFPFESYPIGNKRYTKKYWIDAFNYARSLGVEPIPVFSPWGRVLYLKNMPGGTKYFVEDASVKKNKPRYRNLDVANPEAVKVAMALQKEIIDTLKPKGFCIAMDEIHWANTVSSPAAKAKNWKPSDWFVSAVNYSYKLFKDNGVKLYIWGDMIDPGYNGKEIDMCGPGLLARLPKDIAVLDWKYDGRKDYTVDFPSMKMFTESGVETIGAPWYKTKNIPRMANAVMRHKAGGMCLTSWHSTQVEKLKPELIRSLGLMAYYSWSPEDCNLDKLSFLPDISVHAAVYWDKADYVAEKVTTLKYDKNLTSGDKLAKLIGFPVDNKLGFIDTPFKNYRGVFCKVFKKSGNVAAIVVTGNDKNYQGVLKNGTFACGLKGWTVSNKSNGTISEEKRVLKINAPSGKAFMRAFQDVQLEPGKRYSLHYRVKVAGEGYGRVFVNVGHGKSGWDRSKIFANNMKSGSWRSGRIVLPAKYDKARISFSAVGKGTAAWFDDVELRIDDESSSGPACNMKNIISVNRKAKVITFMHSTNKQDLIEDLYGMSKKFKGIVPGMYVINYEDGSKIDIPLVYRENICAVNDNTLAYGLDLGLFGTVGERLFVNIPTFTWVNPMPEKVITSIGVMPGNSGKMSVLVFGISIE